MGSLTRNMAILTLPAVAVGALAGLALSTFSTEPQPGEAGAGEAAPEAPPQRAQHRQRPPRQRERAGAAERGGATRRVIGNAVEGIRPLDPSYAARLSSPDESVRHACALELLRMGTSRAGAVDLLAPATPEGEKLRDAVVNSLTVLGMIERGGSWETMPEQGKFEVQLKYFAKVVPLSLLREERLRYWTARAARDAERLASGGIDPGEAAWATLELAALRHEAGELGADQWTRLRAEKLGAMRAWVAGLEAERGGSRDRIAAAHEAIARLEKL